MPPRSQLQPAPPKAAQPKTQASSAQRPQARPGALTLLQEFRRRWQDCTACDLSGCRSKMVLMRGTVPCDVLFVGEAPGKSEDVLGIPFVGPAGKLLDEMVARALPATRTSAYTNLVCCLPLDERGDKTEEPPDEAIEACSLRLIEFVELANPKLICCVGKLAFDWLEPGYKHSIQLTKHVPLVRIEHPASILRQSYAQRDLSVQRAVVTLANAVEEIFSPS